MKKLAIGALLGMLASGCAITPITPETIYLSSQFDAAQMEQLMQRGTNQISGSALIRQQGGGVVTCAGNGVMLMPVMLYSSERMRAIYGSEQSGYFSFSGPLRVREFEPDHTEYLNLSRVETCDAQGKFAFDQVGDGNYYVVTTVHWQIGVHSQGGHLMQQVQVAGGERRRIVLSP